MQRIWPIQGALNGPDIYDCLYRRDAVLHFPVHVAASAGLCGHDLRREHGRIARAPGWISLARPAKWIAVRSGLLAPLRRLGSISGRGGTLSLRASRGS